MRAERIHSTSSNWWRTAQVAGLVLTAALLVALAWRPGPALVALWYVAIPLVPASLLVSPALWRNVCPLATLSSLTNGALARLRLDKRAAVYAWAIGIALFALLVPARRFVFNADGAALAVTVVTVALLALALGAVYDLKAGFCNAICPVLPVERLYGQRPLLAIGNPRCHPCSLCTQTGCIDLAPAKAIAQSLGPSRRDTRWLATPFGLFAGALPGFIYGYFTLADSALDEVLRVYARIGQWSLVSVAVVVLLAWGLRISAGRLMPALATAAVAIYYWFTPPAALQALGLGDAAVLPLRVLFLGLITVWWLRTFHSSTIRAEVVA